VVGLVLAVCGADGGADGLEPARNRAAPIKSGV
jgi:hypothetical protein